MRLESAARARLETANGYRLTADGMLMAVEFLLQRAPVGGYYAEHADGRALRGAIARIELPSVWT